MAKLTDQDRMEAEATQFAMCLLMPEALLRQDLERLRKARKRPLGAIDTEKEVPELAKLYKVTTAMMLFRLQDLGVVLSL